MESILFSKENGIATITLNRPDKFNSVTKEIALGMQQFLKECAEDAEVRCVVITAKGKAFCAGQDLAEATHPDSPDLSVFVSKHYNPIIKKIREIEKTFGKCGSAFENQRFLPFIQASMRIGPGQSDGA